MKFWISLGLAMLMVPSAFSQKQYFNRPNVVHFELDFGKIQPNDDSDYFDFLEERTTFDRDDLEGPTFQFRALYQLNNQVAIGGAIQHYEESSTAEDALYVDENNAPILQTNALETTWGGVSLVWTPFGAGETFGTRGWAPRRFVPYLSVGLGIKDWQLRSSGEFVDDADLNDPIIFQDRFVDDGNVFSTRVGCGLRVNLHRNLDINFALQRDFAEDDLEGSYVGFGELDLGSKSAMVGIIFRL